MGRITTEIPNASGLIKHARDSVAAKPLREALLALAAVVRVTDFAQETENARELMEKYPLQGLFGGVTMDHSGGWWRARDRRLRPMKESSSWRFGSVSSGKWISVTR